MPPTSAPERARGPACDPAESGERLVVDWSPLDRSKLEAAARRGVVPVRLDGCRARIVDGCTIRRSYSFAATSRQREVMELRERDEIEARLPILALRFGASVARATSVDVAMTVVGRYELGAAPVTVAELEGECDGATHVVAGLSVGAFAIATGSASDLAGDADFARVGSARSRRHLDAAGIEAACAGSHRADAAPPDDCAIPLRVELRSLHASTQAPPPAPAPATSGADAMRSAMEAAKKELGWCHHAARARDPDLSGSLTLSVKLGARGNVRSVAAKTEGSIDDALSACAVERVGHVLFPASDDGRAHVVVVPVLFRPLAR